MELNKQELSNENEANSTQVTEDGKVVFKIVNAENLFRLVIFDDLTGKLIKVYEDGDDDEELLDCKQVVNVMMNILDVCLRATDLVEADSPSSSPSSYSPHYEHDADD